MLALVLIALAAPEAAAAPRALHMGAEVHAGWMSYEQLNWSDRRVRGPALDGVFQIGARVLGDWFAGGSGCIFLFPAGSGEKVETGHQLDPPPPPLAAGILLCGTAGWAPPDGRFRAALTLGWFWGGAPSVWGGYGVALVPAVNVAVTRYGR